MPVDFLAANVLTGANATLSLGFWRLEPFFQFGQYLRVFADSVTISDIWHTATTSRTTPTTSASSTASASVAVPTGTNATFAFVG